MGVQPDLMVLIPAIKMHLPDLKLQTAEALSILPDDRQIGIGRSPDL